MHPFDPVAKMGLVVAMDGYVGLTPVGEMIDVLAEKEFISETETETETERETGRETETETEMETETGMETETLLGGGGERRHSKRYRAGVEERMSRAAVPVPTYEELVQVNII